MTAENRLGEVVELPVAPGSSRRTERPAKPNVASACNWRASSYDLLRGLTVRDVSETIPAQMFEALFSSDAAVAPVSVRKRR
jgi:hypothetical protein